MQPPPNILQSKDWDCGHVCAVLACRQFGAPEPECMANAVQGMPPDTLSAVLRRAGLNLIEGVFTICDLRHFTKDRPVLCPTSIAGGHWAYVFDVKGQRVAFHDPDKGPRAMSVRQWMQIWHDSTRLGHAYTNWGICPWRP